MKCKKHKIEMEFRKFDWYEEEENDGEWWCRRCIEISEKKRIKEINKTCNVVVRIEDVILKNHPDQSKFPECLPEIIYFKNYNTFTRLHGGKKLKQKTFGCVDKKNGYLKSCDFKEAEFVVII